MVSDIQSQANSHITVANWAFRSGDYHAALRNLNIAWQELSEEEVGLSQDRLASLHHLSGKIYTSVGMYEEAERAFAEAIEAQAAGAYTKERCSDMRHLAEVYRLRGKLAEAEQLYKQCIAELKDLGPETALAKAYMGLGQVSIDADNYEQSEQAINLALDLFERNRGTTSYWYGRCLMVLARLRFAQGELVESQNLLIQALAKIELQIGPYHPLRALALKLLSKTCSTEADGGQSQKSLAEIEEIESYLRDHDV